MTYERKGIKSERVISWFVDEEKNMSLPLLSFYKIIKNPAQTFEKINKTEIK